MKIVVLVLLYSTLVYAQCQIAFYIDHFKADTSPLIIQIPRNPSFPIMRTASTQASSVVGNERKILLQANSGSPGLVLTAGVSGGNFSAATPARARGFSNLTYDGTGSSSTLNPSGLYGSGYSNFLNWGGFALSVSIRTDANSTITFNIYSGSISAVCQATLNLSPSSQFITYYVNYANFSTGCDFANVGAVVIKIMQSNGIDIQMQYISVCGTEAAPPQTPTTTPSPVQTSSSISKSPIYTFARNRSRAIHLTSSHTPFPGMFNHKL